MTDELNPESGESASPVDATEAADKKKRMQAAVLAVAVLALPLGYLALHSRQPQAVMASQPLATAGGDNIEAAEALVHTSPTEPNKINLSLAYINGGAPFRAIPVLEQVVAADPKSDVAWNDLCVALTLQKDYARAIDDCNQALTIKPDFTLARNNLKWASDEKQKTLAAITTAEKTAPVKDSAFYINEGMNDIHVGDYDQAIVAWQAALKLDPKSAVAVNDIGTAYMMKKQPQQAIPYFAKAIQLDPAMQLAKNNMAWAQGELRK